MVRNIAYFLSSLFEDKRIVVIPNILNETGISTLRAHLDNMNSIMIENATPFSPECFILFSPEFIFTDLEVKTKEECFADTER